MHIHMISEQLKQTYGCKVYKLALSSGCSCPNRDGTLSTSGCIFCDGAGAFAASGDIPSQLVKARSLVSAKAGSNAKYIAYFQSFTNTYGDPQTLKQMYFQAIEPEDVVILSIATRPDCLNPEMLAVLKELSAIKPVWVELGLQTIHEETARWMNRGYPLTVFEQAMRDLKAIGVTVIVHQILGFPTETVEQAVETTQYIAKVGADGIKLHMLHILKNTPLALEYEANPFPLYTREEYTKVLIACLRVLPKSMIVHRLTGDGARKDLIAPLWTLDKKRTLNYIRSEIERA